jgi:hypothetical protein
MRKWTVVCLLAIACQSCREKKAEHCLIDGFHFEIPLVNSPEELFEGTCRQIPLENTPEALIGNVNKIVKWGTDYYILSDDRRILHFNRQGKYLSSLDRRGGGPGEYAMLSDFDLYGTGDSTEIWLCDVDRIRKYALTDGEWHFKDQLKFDFTVNKFKIVDEYILLLTGQNEASLTLTDMKGKPAGDYLKKEIPFLVFKPVQFIRYDSCLVFQLGASNEAVLFHTGEHVFSHARIVNERFLSSAELLDMYKKWGYDYVRELSQTRCIRNFHKINGMTWIEYYQGGERFIAAGNGNVWKRMKVSVGKDEVSSMATAGLSDTSDSFIIIRYPSDDNLNITVVEYDGTPSAK